jgi:hypothetical protein
MKRRYVHVIAVLTAAIVVIAGCVKRKETPTPVGQADDLERLVEWMSGSFSSQAQAEQDSAYYDIRLEMTPIWPERTDGYWLYVEQAMASHLDQPYRQRIYHVTQDSGGAFRSTVYELPEPADFVGSWRTPTAFRTLSPEDLLERTGCDIVLKPYGDTAFAGSTVGSECASELRGATYATSAVVVTESALVSWDRGFDAEDVQVWGAEKGGYVFRKVRAQTSVSADTE